MITLTDEQGQMILDYLKPRPFQEVADLIRLVLDGHTPDEPQEEEPPAAERYRTR